MINKKSEIKVRFAPSPTGLLHVGSFRTALYNWLFARKNMGRFVLRIEDTDQARSKDEYLRSQLADMRWMGLDWEEGPDVGGPCAPYSQMERLHYYKKYADELLAKGWAYHCYCTPDELKDQREASKEPGYGGRCRNLTPEEIRTFKEQGREACLRFRIPDEGVTLVEDVIKGQVPFENHLLNDFVIMKSDGIPTYNFAVVVDDYLMGISHVIRGDEHMSNTGRQALIYDALGMKRPIFCHIPIILNEDRTKLSKRKGAVHLLDYRDRGFLKEALFNFLALLGWAPKDNREIMSTQELIDSFSLDGITGHPAVFDEQKLEWMNGQYMASLPLDDIIGNLAPFLQREGYDINKFSHSWYMKAVDLYRTRAKTLVELAKQLDTFFLGVDAYEEKTAKKRFKPDFIADALEGYADGITGLELFNEAKLEELLRDYSDKIGQPASKLIHAARLAVTGKSATPPLFDVMALTGREETIKRLKDAAEYIRISYETLTP